MKNSFSYVDIYERDPILTGEVKANLERTSTFIKMPAAKPETSYRPRQTSATDNTRYVLSIKDCIKGFDSDRQNYDRLGEITRGTKAFAPNLLEVPSFKMINQTNLISERSNKSYLSWMSNKLKTGLVRSSLPELKPRGYEEEISEDEDENYESRVEEEEENDAREKKNQKFFKNYLKSFNPDLK